MLLALAESATGVGARAAAAQARDQTEDIRVIGRKLRKVQLLYTLRGPSVQRCRARVASADPRIDRILCAVLKRCVAEGRRSDRAALACINQKLDLFDQAVAGADAATEPVLAGALPAIPEVLPALPEAVPPAPVSVNVPTQQREIIVTGRREADAAIRLDGPRPIVTGGLWRFKRSGTLMFGDPPEGQPGNSRPLNFTMCLPEGELETTLRRAAGEASMMPRAAKCGSLRISIAERRIRGRRSCTRPVPGAAATTSDLAISGSFDTQKLTINFVEEGDHNGLGNMRRPVGYRWRVGAERVSDCSIRRRRDERTIEEGVSRLFNAGVAIDD